MLPGSGYVCLETMLALVHGCACTSAKSSAGVGPEPGWPPESVAVASIGMPLDPVAAPLPLPLLPAVALLPVAALPVAALPVAALLPVAVLPPVAASETAPEPELVPLVAGVRVASPWEQ
jgi:hypothetical protein